MTKDDFNLKNVLKESDERNDSVVEDLSDKDELVQGDFSDSDVKGCGCVDKGYESENKKTESYNFRTTPKIMKELRNYANATKMTIPTIINKMLTEKFENKIGNSLRGRLRSAAKAYYEAKQKLKQHEADLWLSTDFKAEGCTNDSMRKAFITSESEDETRTYYDAKVSYDDVKREYELELAELRKKEMIIV
jgi:predicted HicB family RNase H-like nuclease